MAPTHGGKGRCQARGRTRGAAAGGRGAIARRRQTYLTARDASAISGADLVLVTDLRMRMSGGSTLLP